MLPLDCGTTYIGGIMCFKLQDSGRTFEIQAI